MKTYKISSFEIEINDELRGLETPFLDKCVGELRSAVYDAFKNYIGGKRVSGQKFAFTLFENLIENDKGGALFMAMSLALPRLLGLIDKSHPSFKANEPMTLDEYLKELPKCGKN